MSISPLPTSTVRLLDAAIDITSPCDVVKELIDNAIDAGARSVEISISADTVKKIQVRDDGRGIEAPDFDKLGRRAHTSKLWKFEDLRTVGAKTLGFRGEALASINCIATVTVTTRTAQDPVATALHLNPGLGGHQDSIPVPGRTGTTVHAKQLFENVPVRKQYLLKQKHVTFSRIKDLLASYVLALPHIRLVLKVIGKQKQFFSYTPPLPSIEEAVLHVFGKHAWSDALLKAREFEYQSHPRHQMTTRVETEAKIGFEAVIPQPGYGATTVERRGIFISIDSRPILASTKFAKRIVSTLKSQLLGKTDGNMLTRTTDLFLRLNIRCPPGIYDANTAPLKDDILFSDETRVICCFEHLCAEVYRSSQGSLGREPQLDGEANVQHRVMSDIGTPINSSSSMEMSQLDTVGVVDKDADQLGCVSSEYESVANTTRSHMPNETFIPPSCDALSSHGNDDVPKTASAKMRFLGQVRMDRTESNCTDENSLLGSVDVHIPVEAKSDGSSPGNSHVLSARAITRFKKIDKYFQPKHLDDFEIMNDDTATKSKRCMAKDNINMVRGNTPGPTRLPLQLVTGAALNRRQEQTDQHSDSSGDETESQITGDGLRVLSYPAGGYHVDRETLYWDEQATPSSLDSQHGDASNISSHIRRTDIQGLQNLPSLLALSTPPSTRSLRQPLFCKQTLPGIDHSGANPYIRDSQSRKTDNMMSRDQNAAPRLGHISLSSDNLLPSSANFDAITGLISPSGGGIDSGPQESRLSSLYNATASLPTNKAIDAGQSLTGGSAYHRPNTLEAGRRNLHSLQSDSGSAARINEPYSHSSQGLSMDTSQAATSVCSRLSENSGNEKSITKPHFRRPHRRMLSHRLPLETIPAGAETHELLTTIHVQYGELRRRLDTSKPPEANTQAESVKHPSLLMYAIHDRGVKKRLRDLVESWAEKSTGDVEVDYLIV